MDFDDDLVSELNTSWNTGLIAKPQMYSGDEKGAPRTPKSLNVMGISNGTLQDATVNNSAKIRVRTAKLTMIATNETDLKLYIKNINNIILSKSITGGMWDIHAFDDMEQHSKNEYTVIVEETKFILKSEW